ncbi:MAG: M55 family metallopeptidase [Candidatus Omnitrophica bacterium]|nr:M55 family metallopeptidase [Candidatus Omnitrophota bacterium]
MKIYLMTDLEGVAGVLDFDNWCIPKARYYETAKKLLTLEVNAAVEGFMKSGAKEIIVADGHGWGGINPELLNPRVKLMRGWPAGFPFLLDKSYDAVAWVGQHAKAGTEYAHIAHTQAFEYVDLSVNGISIGEFGQFAMCAGELGIPAIFASGDEAFTKEAKALVPGIKTVSVKTGTTPGKGDDLTDSMYGKRNLSAVHLHPVKARELIKKGAFQAVKNIKKKRSGKIISLDQPFERTAIFRTGSGSTQVISRESHQNSIAALLNLPFQKVSRENAVQLFKTPGEKI